MPRSAKTISKICSIVISCVRIVSLRTVDLLFGLSQLRISSTVKSLDFARVKCLFAVSSNGRS